MASMPRLGSGSPPRQTLAWLQGCLGAASWASPPAHAWGSRLPSPGDVDIGFRPRILMLASTLPRWAGDAEPGFVLDLARELGRDFDLELVTPHAPGAARHEVLHGARIRVQIRMALS